MDFSEKAEFRQGEIPTEILGKDSEVLFRDFVGDRVSFPIISVEYAGSCGDSFGDFEYGFSISGMGRHHLDEQLTGLGDIVGLNSLCDFILHGNRKVGIGLMAIIK